MLNRADNEYLCRIGPGTPMGDLVRQYWIPAVRSNELPHPDSDPLRVRLLGENLIAFRTTSGEVGLIQDACMHRGASLFFGRNEESGLRCVYHGWKYDVTGQCVDMPNEPAESNFKQKIRATAYPCVERNGVIWTYMGKREGTGSRHLTSPAAAGEGQDLAPGRGLPALPDLEANMLGEGTYSISMIHRACNWMQGWEGEMDTVHQAFLHHGHVKLEDTEPGTFDYYIAREPAAHFSVIDTDFGTSYGAWRPAEADTYYWRMAHMLFPFYAMIPTGEMGREVRFAAYVPMDDEHTMHWEIGARLPRTDGAPVVARSGGRPASLYKPNTSDWYGRFNMIQSFENDFLIDREAQRAGQSFTGIDGIRQQDMAVTESMGPIYDRSHEHLGTTDALIVRTRKRLIDAARVLREHGVTPPGVDNPEVYRQRSGGAILPRGANFWEATQAARTEFSASAVR